MTRAGADRQALIELAEVAYYFDQLGAATVDLDGFPHPAAYGIQAYQLEEWITALRNRLEFAALTINNARERVREIYLGSYRADGC